MKAHKIKVKISVPIDTDQPNNNLDIKQSFWKYVLSKSKNDMNYLDLENTFKKNFSNTVKDKLIRKFQSKLHLINNEITELKTLNNNNFQENKEYQDLQTKIILATQIEFGIENITYSSLEFDLIVEPIEKVAKLFDDNYELFRIFFEQFIIPDSFVSTLSIYDDLLPIPVKIYPQDDFQREFERPKSNAQSNANHSKFQKAKWVWILANTSLVVPVIVALVIFNNKFENIEKFRQKNYKEINIERDNLLKNYQELINFQKNSYQDLIKEIQKDTLK